MRYPVDIQLETPASVGGVHEEKLGWDPETIHWKDFEKCVVWGRGGRWRAFILLVHFCSSATFLLFTVKKPEWCPDSCFPSEQLINLAVWAKWALFVVTTWALDSVSWLFMSGSWPTAKGLMKVCGKKMIKWFTVVYKVICNTQSWGFPSSFCICQKYFPRFSVLLLP